MKRNKYINQNMSNQYKKLTYYQKNAIIKNV